MGKEPCNTLQHPARTRTGSRAERQSAISCALAHTLMPSGEATGHPSVQVGEIPLPPPAPFYPSRALVAGTDQEPSVTPVESSGRPGRGRAATGLYAGHRGIAP